MIEKELLEKLDHISNQLDNLTTIVFKGFTGDEKELFLNRQAGHHLVSKPYKP